MRADPAADLPPGMASLVAALRRAIDAPRPTLAFGCLPFTPDRDKERHVPGGPLHDAGGPVARGRCPICRRPYDRPGQDGGDDGVDFLTCAGCHRGSAQVERIVAAQLHADRQRRHLVNHNRELTRHTPIPAILLDTEPQPEAPLPSPGKGKKRSKVPC